MQLGELSNPITIQKVDTTGLTFNSNHNLKGGCNRLNFQNQSQLKKCIQQAELSNPITAREVTATEGAFESNHSLRN